MLRLHSDAGVIDPLHPVSPLHAEVPAAGGRHHGVPGGPEHGAGRPRPRHPARRGVEQVEAAALVLVDEAADEAVSGGHEAVATQQLRVSCAREARGGDGVAFGNMGN